MNRIAAAILGVLLGASAVGAAAATGVPAPEAVRAEAREIFATVVAFQTAEGHGQVPVMAKYLAEQFKAGGFDADDIEIIPNGETASLIVRYRGRDRSAKPVLLLAHMDVVEARAEDWARDPFVLVEENGYFYGRGTADVKQEVALLTATFLRLKRENFVPSRDLVIAFSGDEETTMKSTRDLARRLQGAEFALNGDGGEGVLDEHTGKPTVYYMQGAEKYYVSFELTTHNPGGHSSQPRVDNAIYDLADALEALRRYQFPVMWNDWTLGSFKAAAAVTQGPLGDAMAKFAANPHDAAAADALSGDPQLVGKLRTTCVATMLRGGHAENALPQSATATVNCRVFPGTPLDEVKGTLQRLVGDKVEVKVIGEPHPSDPSPLRPDVVAAVTRAVHANYAGVPVVPEMAAYATDGSIFRAAGIPTYGVSSLFIKDSDQYSHGLNERIQVPSFYAGLDHWYLLIQQLAGARR
ncbi:MAG: M20/M25/M40 family metallo-hydrolase [Gammaproteobacteria bacterium]|nr:M20/M25/M40 family metallo-hydrolase [Gammaproteobacteria bacterium]